MHDLTAIVNRNICKLDRIISFVVTLYRFSGNRIRKKVEIPACRMIDHRVRCSFLRMNWDPILPTWTNFKHWMDKSSHPSEVHIRSLTSTIALQSIKDVITYVCGDWI